MNEILVGAGWVVFCVVLVVGLVCIPLGLGGTFIILGASVVVSVATGFEAIGIPWLIVMASLAVIGEIIESWLGVITVKRFGASNWAMLGTFIGGLAGAAVGTSVLPVIGSLIGAFIGAFVGAFVAEVAHRRELEPSLRAGWGAFLGRVFASVIKFQLGIMMIVIIWFEVRQWIGTPG